MATEPRKLEPRSLAVSLSGGQDVEDLPDGGLLIRSVKMLAEGTWTDSALQTPLFYPSATLRKDAANWKDDALWSRHSGGMPRSITDRIGLIENQHFADDAVVADLRYHGATQASRDTISLIKEARSRGADIWVSVEHGGAESWNADEMRWEASSIDFYGAAVVNRGACKICTLPRSNEAGDDDNMDELKKQLATLTDQVKALSEQQEASAKELEALRAVQTEGLTDKVKALEEGTKALTDENKALAARVKELETTSAPKTRDQPDSERELEIVRPVTISPTGEVYQE